MGLFGPKQQLSSRSGSGVTDPSRHTYTVVSGVVTARGRVNMETQLEPFELLP